MPPRPPPTCTSSIPADGANSSAVAAFCPACHAGVLMSEPAPSLTDGTDGAVDVARPPAGAWHHDDGVEVVVGASMRSAARALGLAMTSLCWNGVVSFFVLVALASTIVNITGRLPSWFPLPPSKGGCTRRQA